MNDIVDMSQFVEAKSYQLNADDLIGGPRKITVRRVTGNEGDQPVSIFYEGDNNKPFKPCKTMRRVLLAVWGRHAADYVGRSMVVYRDDSVTFGGLNVGGIRISHMSHLDKETVVVVMKTKGKKAGIKIQPLKAEASEDKALNWVEKHIAKIDACATMDDLIALENSNAENCERLKKSRPELHDRISVASQGRAAVLAKEGKPETEAGEAFDPQTGEVDF